MYPNILFYSNSSSNNSNDDDDGDDGDDRKGSFEFDYGCLICY